MDKHKRNQGTHVRLAQIKLLANISFFVLLVGHLFFFHLLFSSCCLSKLERCLSLRVSLMLLTSFTFY